MAQETDAVHRSKFRRITALPTFSTINLSASALEKKGLSSRVNHQTNRPTQLRGKKRSGDNKARHGRQSERAMPRRGSTVCYEEAKKEIGVPQQQQQPQVLQQPLRKFLSVGIGDKNRIDRQRFLIHRRTSRTTAPYLKVTWLTIALSTLQRI